MNRAELINAHFPEYIGGTCLCGRIIHNAADWASHLDQMLTDADGDQSQHRADAAEADQ